MDINLKSFNVKGVVASSGVGLTPDFGGFEDMLK